MVLKNLALSDTKSLITVLSKERGKKLITCHGARKLTGRNMPATQPFCFCEFMVSEKNGRLILRESMLLESFFDLRCNLLDCAVGSYILELGGECAKEETEEEELLCLMLNTLYALCEKEHNRKLIKAAFELRLLSIEGSGPVCDTCVCCGREPGDYFFFSPEEGGLLCASCRHRLSGRSRIYPFDEGARRAMAYIESCPSKRIFSFKLGEKSMALLEKAARESIVYTFEKEFQTLKFYEEQGELLFDEE